MRNSSLCLRAVKSLDDAVAILEKQFEEVETCKADVSELEEKTIEEAKKNEFFGANM